MFSDGVPYIPPKHKLTSHGKGSTFKYYWKSFPLFLDNKSSTPEIPFDSEKFKFTVRSTGVPSDGT